MSVGRFSYHEELEDNRMKPISLGPEASGAVDLSLSQSSDCRGALVLPPGEFTTRRWMPASFPSVFPFFLPWLPFFCSSAFFSK